MVVPKHVEIVTSCPCRQTHTTVHLWPRMALHPHNAPLRQCQCIESCLQGFGHKSAEVLRTSIVDLHALATTAIFLGRLRVVIAKRFIRASQNFKRSHTPSPSTSSKQLNAQSWCSSGYKQFPALPCKWGRSCTPEIVQPNAGNRKRHLHLHPQGSRPRNRGRRSQATRTIIVDGGVWIVVARQGFVHPKQVTYSHVPSSLLALASKLRVFIRATTDNPPEVWCKPTPSKDKPRMSTSFRPIRP